MRTPNDVRFLVIVNFVHIYPIMINFLLKKIFHENLNEAILIDWYWRHLKGALSGLRQFLNNESPLKKMKNTFYFTLKALFVLKIFKFLS